jgi:tetratricopeptide (TPR) repeat protein
MERKKYFITTIILLIWIQSMASNKTVIYKAYISGDMATWKKEMDNMQQQPTKTTDFFGELVNYQYGYIAWCVGMDKNDEAKHYLDLAEKNLEILKKRNYPPSEINAYKSAFYGFKIGLSPWKAPILGPKSVKYAELAMTQDANNPLGYVMYGSSQYHMPAVFGGSKEEAIRYFEKAQHLMEQDSTQMRQNWNYLSLLTQIAESYVEIKNNPKAKAYFEKILQMEPHFLWVKNELYPEFLKETE